MPTIVTRGLGFDAPSVVEQKIGDRINVQLRVVETIHATVTPVEVPVASVRTATFPLRATVYASDAISTVVVSAQPIRLVLKEEGPCMSNPEYQISMFKGDDRTLQATVSYVDGSPVDLTNSEIRFTAKERTSDSQANAVIAKANTAAGGGDTEIAIVDAAGGRCDIFLVPADTEGVNPGTYYYDVEVILASGKKYTGIRSRITLKDDVTTGT